jgi:hypothetical protein
MTARRDNDQDPEILAISQVYSAIRSLDADAQQRVIDYVARKLDLTPIATKGGTSSAQDRDDASAKDSSGTAAEEEPAEAGGDDDLEGISPVAKKWMRRAGFSAEQLSKLFSLGVDEIDLVAKKVPGTSTRDKMRSVILLKGVAAYLGAGVARVTYDQVKEACLHYGVFDNTNFSKYLKSMAAEVSGTKESGYTVTARGLTSATELVRELLGLKVSE